MPSYPPSALTRAPSKLKDMKDVDRLLAERTKNRNQAELTVATPIGRLGGTEDPPMSESRQTLPNNLDTVEGGGGDRTTAVPTADLPANAAPTPTALEWLPTVAGAHYIESTCGRYTVTAAKTAGKWRYTAWRRAPRTLLGCEDELSVAKLLCVDNTRL